MDFFKRFNNNRRIGECRNCFMPRLRNKQIVHFQIPFQKLINSAEILLKIYHYIIVHRFLSIVKTIKQKLLKNLKGKSNRKAQFTTIIAVIIDNNTYFFEGSIKGTIIDTPRGNNGFGYDPIFIPDGYSQTFAELPSEIKNKISHRAIALQKFKNFIINKRIERRRDLGETIWT